MDIKDFPIIQDREKDEREKLLLKLKTELNGRYALKEQLKEDVKDIREKIDNTYAKKLCVDCKEELQSYTHERLGDVDRCNFCGGVWFNVSKVVKLNKELEKQIITKTVVDKTVQKIIKLKYLFLGIVFGVVLTYLFLEYLIPHYFPDLVIGGLI